MKRLLPSGFAIVLLSCSCFILLSSSCSAASLSLEGRFGRTSVDTSAPAMTFLCLRGSDGLLDAKSLLSPADKSWLWNIPKSVYTQAYTYVVDNAGTRYESRFQRADGFKQHKTGDAITYAISGIKLASGKDDPPVAIENWTLKSSGSELIWRIDRKWLQDFSAKFAGTPALYFAFRQDKVADPTSVLDNCVATTFWYDPAHVKGCFEPAYRPAAVYSPGKKLSMWNSQMIDVPNTWAIYKLWTNWQNQVDLKLAVDGGYLYRRGFHGWIGEAGAVSQSSFAQSFYTGQVEKVTLRISGVDKTSTGYQLAVAVPDKAMEASLKSFYSSLLNCGWINDQANYDFGNEVDGWYYPGSAWMQGMIMNAGFPAPALSEHPYDVAGAFREHLSHITGTILDDGRTRFGYSWTGNYVDDNTNTVIGAWAYLIHTGDVAFIRQQLPALEKMLAFFIERRNSRGLFVLPPGGGWYYDAMPASGVTSYHNSMFYLALLDMAQMQVAVGNKDKAREYEAMAARLKKAFNEYLWNEDAPGGPRYCDWITPAGQKVTFATDLCQFPPLAVGIASPEQARKSLATIDKRIAELQAQYGYTHWFSVSAYWPVPSDVGLWRKWPFTFYMNGGSFPGESYWELMARAKSSDADGAYKMLGGFAANATTEVGTNWFTIKGKIGPNAGDEPYLADEVSIAATLVQGMLGINPTWDRLDVKPNLPSGWKDAQADIVYKGRHYKIRIDGKKVNIQPLAQALNAPRPLTWEVRGTVGPEWRFAPLELSMLRAIHLQTRWT